MSADTKPVLYPTSFIRRVEYIRRSMSAKILGGVDDLGWTIQQLWVTIEAIQELRNALWAEVEYLETLSGSEWRNIPCIQEEVK